VLDQITKQHKKIFLLKSHFFYHHGAALPARVPKSLISPPPTANCAASQFSVPPIPPVPPSRVESSRSSAHRSPSPHRATAGGACLLRLQLYCCWAVAFVPADVPLRRTLRSCLAARSARSRGRAGGRLARSWGRAGRAGRCPFRRFRGCPTSRLPPTWHLPPTPPHPHLAPMPPQPATLTPRRSTCWPSRRARALAPRVRLATPPPRPQIDAAPLRRLGSTMTSPPWPSSDRHRAPPRASGSGDLLPGCCRSPRTDLRALFTPAGRQSRRTP